MILNRSILSWCLYDLANTIFAMNMTSYHFPVWLVTERGCPELYYSLAFGGSLLASAALMPRMGRGSDRAGRRMPRLFFWTLGCVAFTAALGFLRPLPLVLLVFALANFCYQLAGVFYNALLPTVSPSAHVGRVSGYGVSLGYVGTLIGIFATARIATDLGRQATFLPTALLFLALAVPSFLWVQEGRRGSGAPPPDERLRQLLRPFFPCAFLGLAAVGTAILFMSVYAKNAVGLTDRQLHDFLIFSTLVTVASSAAWGRMADRLGAYRSLWWAWACWALVFWLAAFWIRPGLFVLVGMLAGVALGGTWVSSRVLLAELAGAARAGEAFGLFGLVSRVAGVVGPVIWSSLVWVMAPLGPPRYRLAMVVLVGFILLGWFLYHRLPASVRAGRSVTMKASAPA